MDNTIYYYQGLYGVIYFLRHNTQMTYVHENDGNFREEYLNPVLRLVGSKLKRVLEFEELGSNVKDELFDMENSTKDEYD